MDFDSASAELRDFQNTSPLSPGCSTYEEISRESGTGTNTYSCDIDIDHDHEKNPLKITSENLESSTSSLLIANEINDDELITSLLKCKNPTDKAHFDNLKLSDKLKLFIVKTGS